MKLKLLTIESSSPPWFAEISQEYEKKISRFVTFEIRRLKAKDLARAAAKDKKEQESKELLLKIESGDFVILLDEKGKDLDTEKFKNQLIQNVEGGVKQITFVVGGAYGSSEVLKKRANQIWKLSDLTMNHFVAQLVTLEQIYRTMTIWKGVPYHNE